MVGIAILAVVTALGGGILRDLVLGAIPPVAFDVGMAPIRAVALGVTTAVGGGVLRDVIALDTPALVRPDSELYAVPAVVAPP